MTEIANMLRKKLQERGEMSFAEFMRLALYCPKYGYYEQSAGLIGRGGDFYTSVSTGALFGQLLAFRFAEWLQELPAQPVQLVEAGAHDGLLAQDILQWLRQNRPKLLESVEYWIIEPSPVRQSWQKARLEHFADRVRWFKSFQEAGAVHGIIFCNELLDSFPVHRLAWNAAESRWFEWGVALENGSNIAPFVWKKLPCTPGIFAEELREGGFDLVGDALRVIPDGFTLEICPEAEAWWQLAASSLIAGRLLTIDYGFTAEHWVAPERTNGTLRGYHHHTATADLLADPGNQDLTAHVNFTQLRRTGEAAGLSTEAFVSQEKFLTGIAVSIWKNKSASGEWTSAQLRQFKTLTHPEHLGRPFSVLVQKREANTD